jgi:hypothetical protein
MTELEKSINRKAIELFTLLRRAGAEIGIPDRQVETELDCIDNAIDRFTSQLEKYE